MAIFLHQTTSPLLSSHLLLMPSPVLQQKPVLLLLLLLSFTLSSVAAHAAATSKPFRVLNPPLDDSDVQNSVEETVDLGDDNTEELAEVKWGDTTEEKKRMTWETTDYPDTGPNHHHHHDSNTPSHHP